MATRKLLRSFAAEGKQCLCVCVRCKKWRYFPTTPRGRFIKIGYFVPRYSALLTWLESNFQELHLHLEENITDGFLCNAAPSSNTDDKASTLYGGNRCHSSPKNSQKVGKQRAPGWGRRAFHSVGVTKKRPLVRIVWSVDRSTRANLVYSRFGGSRTKAGWPTNDGATSGQHQPGWNPLHGTCGILHSEELILVANMP